MFIADHCFAKGIGLSLSAGTPGLRIGIVKSIIPDLNARIGYNFYNSTHNDQVVDKDVEYEATIDLNNIAAIVDDSRTQGFFHLPVRLT